MIYYINYDVLIICISSLCFLHIIGHINYRIVAKILTSIVASCLYHDPQRIHWAIFIPFVAQAALYFFAQLLKGVVIWHIIEVDSQEYEYIYKILSASHI